MAFSPTHRLTDSLFQIDIDRRGKSRLGEKDVLKPPQDKARYGAGWVVGGESGDSEVREHRERALSWWSGADGCPSTRRSKPWARSIVCCEN